jgi:hypothetical protein
MEHFAGSILREILTLILMIFALCALQEARGK